MYQKPSIKAASCDKVRYCACWLAVMLSWLMPDSDSTVCNDGDCVRLGDCRVLNQALLGHLNANVINNCVFLTTTSQCLKKD